MATRDPYGSPVWKRRNLRSDLPFRAFVILTLRRPSPPVLRPRNVYVNTDVPEEYLITHHDMQKYAPEHRYAINQVVTLKYSPHVFTPQSPRTIPPNSKHVRIPPTPQGYMFSLLFIQIFSFFAFIIILQFVPKFTTISPGLVIIPLLVILLITALKDGYEDIKQHQSDQ